MMKKYFIILFLAISLHSNAFADAISSNVTWSDGSGINECASKQGSAKYNYNGHTVSHAPGQLTHYGVPNSNNNSAAKSGNANCTAHSYSQKSTYAYKQGAKNAVTNCPAGERVVKIDYHNGTVQNIGSGNYSGNFSNYTIYCQKFDDTPPIPNNVNFPIEDNLLANDGYDYEIKISTAPGGKPGETGTDIVKVDGKESSNNKTYSTNKCTTDSNTTDCRYTRDIRNVDVDRSSNGGRLVTYEVNKICDEAGNCWEGSIKKQHYIYANTIKENIAVKKVNKKTVANSNIADGTIKELSFILKDKYGNSIVPAPGINRVIDLNFNIDNTMFLNQVNRSGASSVFVKAPDSSSYSNTFFNNGKKENKISAYLPVGTGYGSGEYTYSFKVYTPTANQNTKPVSDINAIFNIKEARYDINSNLTNSSKTNPPNLDPNPKNQSFTDWSDITTKYDPLYYTKFTGEIVDNGIIEGGSQRSSITVSKNNSSTVTTSNSQLQLSYGGTDAGYFDMYGGTTLTNAESTKITTSPTTIKNTNPNFPGNVSPFYSRLVQSKTVKEFSNIYLGTHINYNITNPNGGGNPLNVLYNSDILGKESYHGAAKDALAQQSGIKVDGLASTGSDNDLLNEQFGNDIIVISGNLDKLSSKTQIIKNGYEAARNLTTNVSNNQSGRNYVLTNIDSPKSNTINELNNVIFFGSEEGANSERYTIGNGSDITVSTNKTILAIGADIYIKSNIKYTGNGMLGVISLKDINGKGGNIYIDPNVTNLAGTYFAEKSVLSFDGTKELDGITEVQILKNQLYIYGTLFSENTVGGSRENPPRCPYYLTETCTLKLSQKYDLNYLRRYYLKSDNTPANGGKIATTKTEHRKYPVVIEYNSKIQTTPPPLFSQ